MTIQEQTVQHPEFAGETYSYDDARRRVPAAWRVDVIRGPRGDGTFWERQESRCIAPKGLGHFERKDKSWVYVAPNGYARVVGDNYGLAEPPPLPRPQSSWRKATCHCGPHTCSACGQPYWLEFHGVADGKCTYCYHAG